MLRKKPVQTQYIDRKYNDPLLKQVFYIFSSSCTSLVTNNVNCFNSASLKSIRHCISNVSLNVLPNVVDCRDCFRHFKKRMNIQLETQKRMKI